MSRKYSNLKEGVIDHEGKVYEQPKSDSEFVLIVRFGNLIYVDDLFEIWVSEGKAVILHNQIGILE